MPRNRASSGKRKDWDSLKRRSKASSKNKSKGSRAVRVSAVHEEYYEEGLSLKFVFLSIIGGLILLLPCISISAVVVQQINGGDVISAIGQSSASVAFLIGVVTCLVAHLIPSVRELLLRPYVLGHEITHAIFVFCCYGKVSDFEHSAEGGYIVANRDNILVSLSPYVFPFWTVVAGLLYVLSGVFVDVTPAVPYFFVLFGATWFFNLIWTVIMIPLGQSDLKNNGTFFSLTVIYFSNALICSLLLESARPDPSVTQWFYSLVNTQLDIAQGVLSFILS